MCIHVQERTSAKGYYKKECVIWCYTMFSNTKCLSN